VADAVQPPELVTVTLYVALDPEATETLIDCVVAPFDQRYVEMPVPLAVSVAVPPAQEFAGPLMVTVGCASTLTTVGADVAVQPADVVTVTV
jgi:hypothetical protein